MLSKDVWQNIWVNNYFLNDNCVLLYKLIIGYLLYNSWNILLA
jgi:hypothetical protein